ncbi:protein of unknown function DUF4378 [Dillenia turbinata]|uniref:DUF4378 domain-containing protein n=1 Tax=Dillenia turbinata TaxID=194707 RepID=A0AAN8V5K2_9MAGN
MSDADAKKGSSSSTSMSLVVAEKKPSRPGGCVGIFFQLFDWDRRFAKKKLFSKKLLPPARTKQKFKGDEKMPMAKLLLIADENSGGFPNVKKNRFTGFESGQGQEMRTPGLVARLMGLESMPAIKREKLKKVSFSEVKDENVNSGHGESDKEKMNLEKEHTKNELRPQKLQKTGPEERRSVTPFSAEALQFKSVLSRSRKHQAKLASPVKGPRIASGKKQSRLIDAATRILEPGLQATNRAKCALTYANSLRHYSNDEFSVGAFSPSVELQRRSGYCESAAKSLTGQTSCNSCGNLFDVVESKASASGQAPMVDSTTNFANVSDQESRSMLRLPLSSERETNVLKINEKQPECFASQVMDYQEHWESLRDSKPLHREGRENQLRPQKDVSTSTALRNRRTRPNQKMIFREREPPRPKLSYAVSSRSSSPAKPVNESKDFVSLNRSLSGCSRLRTPIKDDTSKPVTAGKMYYRKEGELPGLRTPVRKRRTMNAARQVACTDAVNSAISKQQNFACGVMKGKGMVQDAQSMVSSRFTCQGECHRTNSDKDINVVSFIFSSPVRSKTRNVPRKEMENNRRDRFNIGGDCLSMKKEVILDKSESKRSFQRPFLVRGDNLGALLEQKLKELTCGENELAGGNRKSTALILQELISALTAEGSASLGDVELGINQHKFSCSSQTLDMSTSFQKETRSNVASCVVPFDGDHPSPESVFEASFSNDSCFSDSVDECSGHQLPNDCMDYSYGQSQPPESDAELFDSAASWNNLQTGFWISVDLLNHVAKFMYSFNLANGRVLECKLMHAKEVILHAELLFGIVLMGDSDGLRDFLISPFLLDELEALPGGMWTIPNFLGFEGTKDKNQLKCFLFDCLVEFLDSEYCHYSKSGFKAWRRVVSRLNMKLLIQEVNKEIKRWTDITGKIMDEIIEREMSYDLGKWTDFELEAFEAGADIGAGILQILVDEVVEDLIQSLFS